MIKPKPNSLKTCKPDFVAFAKYFIYALAKIHSFTEVDGRQRRP